MARQGRPASLSRDAVIGAAETLVRTEGSAVLSMRRLARELGSSPMALQRHVQDKSNWEAGMRRDDHERLYRRMLLELWQADDGDLDDIAAQVGANDLVIHQNGCQQHGARALAQLVRQGRAPFTDVTVAIETGPLIDGDHVAARWYFSGRYAGGIPGATAAEGTPIRFTGIDVVRVAEGRVAESWVCSDDVDLLRQLGAA